jgi:flagellar basal-body rod protein FlgB
MLIKQAIFSSTAIPAVAKSLDAATLRGKAIASNLANITTPGYQRIEVDFETTLRRQLDQIRGDGRKPNADPAAERAVFNEVNPVAYRPDDPTSPGGINNVDVDMEAAKLAENHIAFNYGVRFMQDEKGMIDAAIHGSFG